MRCCLTLLAGGCLWLVGCEVQNVPVPAPPPTVTSTGTADSLTTDDPLAPTAGSTTGDSLTPAPASGETPPTTESSLTPVTGEATAPAPVEGAAPAATEEAAAKPVAVAEGAATLSPENTKIQFVGTHSGDKPDPRTGWFGKFSGKAEVDAAAKSLKSVAVEIDTTSLTTEIPKLTDHLKSGDFFEVNEFPTAKFESTKIEQTGDKATITGNLTLHGVTKEISFPATVNVSEGGVALKSEFDIDRTQFGMTFGEGKVENKVSLTVTIGK